MTNLRTGSRRISSVNRLGHSPYPAITRLLALWLLLTGTCAFGDTITFPTGSMTPMSFPGSLSIGRDAVVGTILNSTSQNAGASASNVTCTIQQITTVNGNVVAGNPKTYQTDVDGIGVRFYITSGWNGSWEQAPTTSSFTVTSGSTAHYVRADLVVTGPISGGTITILPSMTISFTGPCINTLTVTETLVTGTMVTGQACSVTTPAVTVTMQKVAPSDLPSVGATAGNTAFSSV